jgi:hypothetical protein
MPSFVLELAWTSESGRELTGTSYEKRNALAYSREKNLLKTKLSLFIHFLISWAFEMECIWLEPFGVHL